jgi:hypothetical protein
MFFLTNPLDSAPEYDDAQWERDEDAETDR